MNIDNICKAIKEWKNLIDSYKKEVPGSETKILTYLNQGTHFSVYGHEIEQWQKYLQNEDDQAINAYIGIDEDQLKFFLIDSKSDADSNFDTIIVKEFNREPFEALNNYYDYTIPPPSISFESAINRNFRWNMFCSIWLKDRHDKSIFQLISIPFDDYNSLNLDEKKSCISFFGLTDKVADITPVSDYNIDIITVKTLTIGEISKIAENYSTPRPPFTISPEENYNLLIKSDAYL